MPSSWWNKKAHSQLKNWFYQSVRLVTSASLRITSCNIALGAKKSKRLPRMNSSFSTLKKYGALSKDSLSEL